MRTAQTAPTARRPGLWYVTTAASILAGIVPIWVLENWFGVPRKISVGYGIIAYVIGTTVLKLPLHHFVVERILRPRLATSSLAAVHGALSAVSELAPAAAFFVYVVPHLTWWQLVGFGVGAGAVEAIMLPFLANPLKGTSLEEHADDVFRRSATNSVVQWLSVLERIWAMLLQVGTRGLVGLSVYSANPLPACLAVVGFGTVDGIAYYGHLRKWRFDSLPVLARVHLFLGLAASVIAVVFLWWSGVVWLGVPANMPLQPAGGRACAELTRNDRGATLAAERQAVRPDKMGFKTAINLSLLFAILVVAAACSPQQLGLPRTPVSAASPDGRWVASVRNHPNIDPPSQSIWLQSADGPGKKLRTLRPDSDWSHLIVWSQDSSTVAFLVQDAKLTVVDARTGEIVSDRWLTEWGGEHRPIVWFETCRSPPTAGRRGSRTACVA